MRKSLKNPSSLTKRKREGMSRCQGMTEAQGSASVLGMLSRRNPSGSDHHIEAQEYRKW